MGQKFFSNYYKEINQSIQHVNTLDLIRVAKLIKETSEKRKKVILVGNGGSAAMASHVAVDLTKVAGVRSVNFNEADLITCFANDYGYENVFEKALNFYGDRGDTLISISSSGMSKNILKAVSLANKKDIAVITFSGFDPSNSLRNLGKFNFWVDSRSYNVVEMTHHIWLVSIVDYLVEGLNKSDN